MSRPRALVVEDDRAIREGWPTPSASTVCRRAGGARATPASTRRCTAAATSCSSASRPARPRTGLAGAARAAPRPPHAARHHPEPRGGGERPGARPARRADDYITKPFSIREAAAPAAPTTRRSPRGRPGDVRYPAPARRAAWTSSVRRCVFTDGARCELAARDRAAPLPGREPGPHVSREELLSARLGCQRARTAPETRTVDVHVARLRTKLRDHGTADAHAGDAVRGKGYRLDGGSS